MARGGSRTGTPGKSYGNRSDLQGVKVATGQPYGVAQQLENAQRAIPLRQTTAVPAPSPNPAPPGAGPAAMPGQMPFDRPTERPDEPVTAGIPEGAGQGPEALTTVGPATDDVGAQLRALYAMTPNNDILRLIELHDNGY